MKIAFGLSGAARLDESGDPYRKAILGRLGEVKEA
jgi:hypothetical protein